MSWFLDRYIVGIKVLFDSTVVLEKKKINKSIFSLIVLCMHIYGQPLVLFTPLGISSAISLTEH